MMQKTILITGATSGIGKATALALAEKGHKLILVCRNREKMDTFIKQLNSQYRSISAVGFILDFSSLESVRECAAELSNSVSTIDVLINNAGTFNLQRHETADGFEHTFGVNHLGPFLFTELILPLLEKGNESRIINVGSDAHKFAKLDFDDLFFEKKKYSGFKAYGASRLATVFFTQELAEQLRDKSMTVNCVHPGHVSTNIWNFADNPTFIQKLAAKIQNSTAISPDEGAQTVVYLAVSNEIKNKSGAYFADKKEKKPSPQCKNKEVQRKLWNKSCELTGL